MEPTPPELGAATGSPHGLIVEAASSCCTCWERRPRSSMPPAVSTCTRAFTLRAEPGDADRRPGAGRGRVEASDQPDRPAGDDPPGPGQQPAGRPRGAPRLGRHNLPQRSYAPEIRLTLAPFSEQTLRRFLYIERPEGMDISSIAGELDHDRPAPPVPTGPLVPPAPQAFSSIGQLYRGIEWGLRGLVDRYGEERVFVGSPNAQASTRYFRVPEPMRWSR